MMIRRYAVLVMPVAVWLGACTKNILVTDRIVGAFNSGALDTSGGDPFHSPDASAIDLVAARIRQELGDGYFGQGPVSHPYVADWMKVVSAHSLTFARLVDDLACSDDVHVGRLCGQARQESVASRPADGEPGCPAAAAARGSVSPSAIAPSQARGMRARLGIRTYAFCWSQEVSGGGPPTTGSFCGSTGERDREQFADFVRFEAALERAARVVASLVVEGLVDSKHVVSGANLAFSQTADYLRDRGWHRSSTRKTTALVVKGGASTGVFSAGAVWVMLNMINECLEDAECKKAQEDFRFHMMSGTSTGAMVATVVDMFNTRETHAQRGDEMQRLASWFTCSGTSDLYCVRSRPLLDLARDQDSLLDFDGLTRKLRDNVCCDQVRNSSELILNTVDFRSGRLLALSDQERFALRSREDVVQGALASAVLPVIARPVYTLPTNYDPGIHQAYLDGGIRSEIPLMSVARRGAERVLVVGSGSSVTGETGPLTDAVGVAARYVDISTSGVVETELAWSQSHVQSLRLSEQDECGDELDEDAGRFKKLCDANAGCDRAAICDWRWSEACGGARKPASKPSLTPTLDERLEPVWKMAAILRNERRVEPLHGYTFDPREQRRLFMAGAEAVRVSCVRVAKMLGIPVPDDASAPLRSRLVRWCAPDLSRGVCGAPSTSPSAAPPNPPTGPSACSGAIPPPSADLLLDCRAAATPGACPVDGGAR
jgi:predicted acylesterase/phospholipase RssA